jgi:CSLREA domain-containing protein
MTRGMAIARCLRWALALCPALLALPAVAGAATITPNTTLDQFNADPSACSLREAIQAADTDSNAMAPGCNAGSGPEDTIQLAPGTYELSIDGDGAGNESGDLNFIGNLRIEALPGGPAVIDANGIERIIFFSGELFLVGVSVTGGLVGDPDPSSGFVGGGIASSGGSSLTISEGAVFGNRADSSGGGIAANGPLTLRNVTVSDNVTEDAAGGGVDADGASLTLDHVTITDNHSEHDNPAQSLVTGGLYSAAATTSVHNSVIAGNTEANTTSDAPDCQTESALTIVSSGGNVLGDSTGCPFTSLPTDSVGSPAMLEILDDNGGFTRTHALMPGSPALERGVAPCLPADQRGYPRPSPAGGQCDSGAYELFACPAGPLNQPGAFAGCPVPAAPGTPPPARKKKCKKKKRKGAKKKKRCKRKKGRLVS